MKIWVNGVTREATPEEAKLIEAMQPTISYDDRVEMRIAERYSIGKQIAILRQKDEKPEEDAEFYAFAEQIKAEERNK